MAVQPVVARHGVRQAGQELGPLRERIVDEAATLFVRFGYHGLSMRQISEAVGVSKAGLYYHFVDKEALFLAILLQNIDRVGEVVDEARGAGGSTRDVVTRLVRALLTRMAGSQRFIRLAEQDASSLRPVSREAMREAYRSRFIDPIIAILRVGVERGELRAVDPEPTTWLLLGLTLAGLSSPPEKVAGVVKGIVSVFFDGVAMR